MARNLYDLGDDRSSVTDQWLREREDKRARIVPRGGLLVAAVLAGIGALLLKDLLPDSASKKEASTITIIDDFRGCDDAGGHACVLGPDRYSYQGRSYRVADIVGPSLTSPACAHEGELAQQGRMALLALMNGGAFEAHPDPNSSGGRLLIRDGVSLGSLLVLRGFAAPASAGKTDWCAGN